MSWVIVENKTGKAVREIYSERLAAQVNTESPRYTAVPILEYLVKLNQRERKEERRGHDNG